MNNVIVIALHAIFSPQQVQKHVMNAVPDIIHKQIKTVILLLQLAKNAIIMLIDAKQ